MYDDEFELFAYKSKKVDDQEKIGSSGSVLPYCNPRKKPAKKVVKFLSTKNIKGLRILFRSAYLNFNHDSPLILSAKTAYINELSKPKSFDIIMKYPRMKNTLEDMIYEKQTGFFENEADKYFSKNQILEFVYTIALGLDYLKKKGIAHQNLKPTNIMFDEEGNLKLMDIGLAQELFQSDTASFIISKRSPEFYKSFEAFVSPRAEHKIEFYQSDIWSLGMIILDLCLLDKIPSITPFMKKEERERVIQNAFGGIKERYGEDLSHLIECLLKGEPDQRITVSDLIEKIKTNYPDIKPLMKGAETKKVSDEEKLKMVADSLNDSMKDIFKIAKNKQLSINAADCSKVTDAKIKETLVELEKRIKDLKLDNLGLSMNFKGCNNITNQGLESLGLQLSQNFQSLESLSLALGSKKPNEKTPISNEGLQRFTEQICDGLKALKSLKLDLNNCVLSSVNMSVFQSLSTSIMKLKKLDELSLDFGLLKHQQRTHSLTDGDLSYVSLKLAQLKDLKTFSLTLRGHSSLTDIGLKKLSVNLIEDVKKIENLSFCFYRCEQVTDEGVKTLISSIKKHQKNLKSLKLNFFDCPEVSTNIKEYMKSSLDFIPNLCI